MMTAALFWVGKNQWHLALLAYGLSVLGFAGANIFYDALLPAVSDERSVDFVSGLGYSMGYLGGGILFLINVLMVLFPEKFYLPDAGAAVRYSFLSVALWWGGFCLFPLAWIRETGTIERAPVCNRLTQGLRQLRITLSKIRRLKNAGIFLLAYWFYIDGVDTIIRMAVDYGLSLGFTSQDLILSLLLVQFVGFPAALGFGRLGQRWGAKKSILLGIAIYMGVTVWGSLMTTRASFYGLAVMIGLVQGGVQALSRSYYSRLIPKDQAAEFYGFYNMMGKFSAIVGPALMATIGLAVRRLLMPENPTVQQLTEVGRLASRWSIASVLILFIIGAGLLMMVDEEKGRRELEDFTANAAQTGGAVR
jgi:UMF1 family MFS transporter